MVGVELDDFGANRVSGAERVRRDADVVRDVLDAAVVDRLAAADSELNVETASGGGQEALIQDLEVAVLVERNAVHIDSLVSLSIENSGTYRRSDRQVDLRTDQVRSAQIVQLDALRVGVVGNALVVDLGIAFSGNAEEESSLDLGCKPSVQYLEVPNFTERNDFKCCFHMTPSM